MTDGSPDPDSTFKVMVASDVHLGYLEKDPVRGDDSFLAFEEVLQRAQENECDFLLLAGDLFHDNKPSRKTMQRCMELLRDNCLGSREVRFTITSNQNENFHDKHHRANYEDPNYNVELPVFSIHGNHDDPAGDGGLAALDVLSTSNLLNYFGRAAAVSDIQLQPILLEKGSTKVALYGLGHIRDERLHRVFADHKVTFLRPAEGREDWFNICCVHQNRLTRGATSGPAKGYLKESFLPDFLDLVVWGHEHTCQLQGGMAALAQSASRNFTVLQPGSTVATSLHIMEAAKKHIALLHICGEQWKMEAIPLDSVRSFMHKDIVLRELPAPPRTEEQLMDVLTKQVEELISLADAEAPSNLLLKGREKLTLPLIRLRIEYSECITCNPQRFGAKFVGRVANPNELLLFYRKAPKRMGKPAGKDGSKDDKEEDLEGAMPGYGLHTMRQETRAIEDLVADLMKESGEQLSVLQVPEFNDAVHEYVHKETIASIRTFVQEVMERTAAALNADEELASKLTAQADPKQVQKLLADALRGGVAVDGGGSGGNDDALTPRPAPKRKRAPAQSTRTVEAEDDDEDPLDDDDDGDASAPRARRPAAGGDDDDDDDDEEEVATPAPVARGRGRGRGRTAPTARGGRGGRGPLAAVPKSRAKPTASRGRGKAATAGGGMDAMDLAQDDDMVEIDEEDGGGGGRRGLALQANGFARSTGTAAAPSQHPKPRSAAPPKRVAEEEDDLDDDLDDIDDADGEDDYAAQRQKQAASHRTGGAASWGAKKR